MKKKTTKAKKRKNFRSRFESKVEELKAYKAEHGHFKVKQKENMSLYNFCLTIRAARKTTDKSNRKLTADRIAQLDAIGFDWDKYGTAEETVAPLSLATTIGRLLHCRPGTSMTVHSRKCEFEADEFSSNLGMSRELQSGLCKIHLENLGAMCPDPWYSAYHYSHPPLVERLSAMMRYDMTMTQKTKKTL